MRILNRKAFLALPAGVLFSKYTPCVFDALCIKGNTWDNDFLVQGIADAIACTGSEDFSDKLFLATETGESLPMDFHSLGRDGCFDEDQLFAVWETEDFVALLHRLGI